MGINVQCRLWNWFYGICCSIFNNLEFILRDRRYCYQDMGKNVHSPTLRPVFGICCSIFSTFEGILSRSKVPLAWYGWKRSFSSFETNFTAFAVLFYHFWMLFFINQRYCCQDIGEHVHSPVLKLDLRHSLFYFYSLEVILCQSKAPLPRYVQKSSLANI